jgi:hypothetical protein
MRLAVTESNRRRQFALLFGAENETFFDLTKAVELLSGRSDMMHAAPDHLMTIIRSPDANASLAKNGSACREIESGRPCEAD